MICVKILDALVAHSWDGLVLARKRTDTFANERPSESIYERMRGCGRADGWSCGRASRRTGNDRRTDRRTDERKDGRTDGVTGWGTNYFAAKIAKRTDGKMNAHRSWRGCVCLKILTPSCKYERHGARNCLPCVLNILGREMAALTVACAELDEGVYMGCCLFAITLSMLGQSYTWRLFGHCLEIVWRLFGDCLQSVWRLLGDCLEIVWRSFGYCLEIFFGDCLGIVWRLFGECLEIVWRLFGDCLEIVWALFGECLEIV